MKSIVVFISLLVCSQWLYAADYTQKSEKGIFSLELTVSGKGLKNGSNTLEVVVRDKGGKSVEGGDLTVTPWFPAMGHGVWDKPAVTDKGSGKYIVRNVLTNMTGKWELRFDVKKGSSRDRAVFVFNVSDQETSARKEVERPRGKYDRSVQYYNIPNVTLLNQDGKKVKIRELVDSGKPVIIDFIYTTCTTICPVLSATFTNLRKELGADADKVQLISLSIDPEHDRPEQMKKYLSRYKAGKGWDFLTGSREDIDKVLRSLSAIFADKMAHEPIYVLHTPNSDEWVRIKGLLTKGDLLYELKRMEAK
jgi:protein SCO1/2